jgi:hypothetical protein
MCVFVLGLYVCVCVCVCLWVGLSNEHTRQEDLREPHSAVQGLGFRVSRV